MPWNQTIATAENTFDIEQNTMITKLNRGDCTSPAAGCLVSVGSPVR